MNNIIYYYYGIYVYNISKIKDNYFFNYYDNIYVLYEYKRPIIDLNDIYRLNEIMIDNNMLVHKIILTNDKKTYIQVDNKNYVLMQIYINQTALINLPNISYINNNTINIVCPLGLKRDNWVSLWEAKVDYFESQINEVGRKYKNICNYLNYYIGLCENAISYIKNNVDLKKVNIKCINHRRINANKTLIELYNPINFIYDYRIRDISEYIKSLFFNGIDPKNVIINYFNNNYIYYEEALLFYARLLYPSYFFDIYDEIINNNKDESSIEKIINKSKEYEMFLIKINIFLSNIYKRYIPQIDWLKKRSYF